MRLNRTTLLWKVLPVAAIVIAGSFIAWEGALMARTTKAQTKLNGHMQQLKGLSVLNSAMDRLAQSHDNDVRNHAATWPAQLDSTRQLMAGTLAAMPPEPGIVELQATLANDLAKCDSLHQQAMLMKHDPQAAEMANAVFSIMLRGMRGHLESTVRLIHRQGLERETVVLNGHWSQAHWLLAAASLLALLCAALVIYVSRLLQGARERSELLARTGEELEQSNRNLRETMLSKEEKEVMLKEIHHRVKNNLQIVRSLIRFQTDKVTDPRTMELFNECVNRVGAMALVHEQTYMSKDLANIDVADYLKCLIRDLVSAYNIKLDLKLDVQIQMKTLGVDTLTPLGLLINEVVSNSFKHAFKGRSSGTIVLHLSGTPDGGLYLRIGDDGVGLADKARWENPSSLGMELIHTLAGQLNAELKVLPGSGLVYEFIAAPEMEVRRRA